MSVKIMTIIKKHAGAAWLTVVGLTFVFTFAVCSIILNIVGVTPFVTEKITIGVSAFLSIVMYITLAIWGLRNL